MGLLSGLRYDDPCAAPAEAILDWVLTATDPEALASVYDALDRIQEHIDARQYALSRSAGGPP